MDQKSSKKRKSIYNSATWELMIAGVVLNLVLSWIVKGTDLPFYFDTVGTITVTALGGTVPGMFTAFFTNAINFLTDGESIFYAPLNMMIAVASALFYSEQAAYKRKKINDKKPERADEKIIIDHVCFILVMAVIGGVLGAAITWYLYASPSEAPMIVGISKWLASNFGIGIFGCHMISTYITDVIDKTISFSASIILIKIVPKRIREDVRMDLWRQKPLTYEEQKNSSKKIKSRLTIGVRINIILVLSTVLLTGIVSAFSIISFRTNMIEQMSENAKQIAYLAAQEIDPELVDEFIEKGYYSKEYIKTWERLSSIKKSSPTITFLYVYKIEEDCVKVVFDLDAKLSDGTVVEGDPPGTVIDMEEAYKPYIEELLAGKMVPPLQVHDEYGSFLTVYYPVYDMTGHCVCYAVSNIETTVINEYTVRFFGRVLLLFAGFFIMILTISILTTRYHVVMPILGMAINARELVDPQKGINEDGLSMIRDLDIHTQDETEMLYKALRRLTGDMVSQLNDIEYKSEAITKMQSGLIITMADMVESRDSDTGAHVLKTAAYVRIILQGLKRNGYYAEKLTDKYMNDVEMSAPLHDVGKINISDTILNKAGKLTDEEYEIMKTHTTAGKKILEKAIDTMEGDNYLKEARNMAAYHHERWDGKGYPEGLHGEVIPLSARVMAVADVFDALSSPRVYKPAFPFDEAVRIIQEGAGTQFDPKCVEVFTESLTEVKKVLKKYQEK